MSASLLTTPSMALDRTLQQALLEQVRRLRSLKDKLPPKLLPREKPPRMKKKPEGRIDTLTPQAKSITTNRTTPSTQLEERLCRPKTVSLCRWKTEMTLSSSKEAFGAEPKKQLMMNLELGCLRETIPKLVQ